MQASVEEIFHGARSVSLVERQGYLDRACGGDTELRARVEALLKADQDIGSFLDPAARGLFGVEGEPPRTVLLTLPEQPGSRIGRYKLLQQIGEGGFGTVWMAEQEQPVVRRVALKIIKLGMDTRQVIARFEAERQALAMMEHPNIARVLDAGATDSGRPYFVMELVKGESITRYCDRNNLSVPERLGLFAQICQAVQHAHTKGIIHRDIKPTNVLVSGQDGRPFAKVIDFGIAKATNARLTEKTLFTEHRQLIGTLEYMSPEQAEGSLDLDTRTDIYSLGVLLYELLTGKPPFDSQALRSAAFAEIQRIIRETEPFRPSQRCSHETDALPSVAAHRHTDPRSLCRLLRGELDWIVMKALEKDRARRYETAGALGEDVQRFLAHDPVIAGPPGRGYRLAKLVRRNRGLFGAGVAIAAALIAGLVVASYGLVEARGALRSEARQRQIAERALVRAGAIQEFFQKRMLGPVYPDDPRGQTLTVREVLDQAAREIGELKDREMEALFRHQIGTTYAALALLTQAREQLEAALRIRRSLETGASDPRLARGDTAESMLELARVLRAQEDGDLGEDLAKQARAVRAELFGTESVQAQEVSLDLADTFLRRDRLDEAAEAYQQIIAWCGAHSGEAEERLHAAALKSYGIYLSDQQRMEEASSLLSQAVAMHRARGAPAALELADTLTHWAHAVGQLGQLKEAEALVREAMEVRAALLPPVNPEHAQSLLVLSTVLQRSDPSQAEQFARRALQLYAATLGDGHEYVGNAARVLGVTLARQKRWEEAASEFAKAAAVYANKFNSDDHRLAIARSMQGGCLVELKQFAAAEPLLLGAEQELNKTRKNPEALVVARRRLVQLYVARERPEEQQHWERELEEAEAALGAERSR
jgi:eukaryotic-like serine/threonine-protein kinase